MMNFWPKKHFYIYKVLLLIVLCSNVYGQNAGKLNTLRIHFVSTHKKATLTPETEIVLNQFFRAQGIQAKIDQFIHPLQGKLNKIYLQDTLPFYAEEMRNCRDAFFNSIHPKTEIDYYVFLTQDKIDTNGNGFSIFGKNILFLAAQPEALFLQNFSKYFLKTIGNVNTDANYSMDSLASYLKQREFLKIENESYFFFHDDSENTDSKNGLVAYYFWKQNAKGALEPTNNRYYLTPYKRNFGKVNLDVDNYWFRPFYVKNNRFIAPIHLGLVALAFFIMLVFRKKVNKRAEKAIHNKHKIGYLVVHIALWMLFAGVGTLVFFTTDTFYKQVFFNSTDFTKFGNQGVQSFKRYLDLSSSVVDQPAKKIYSEVYVKSKGKWHMRRMKKVLYFKVKSIDGKEEYRFQYSSNTISIKGYEQASTTHLVVLKFENEEGKTTDEKVLNYAGFDITQKLLAENPPKRILVLVNGYRPVSTSESFDESMMQIGKNGVEYPNSMNLLFEKDRFNYWTPWKRLNQQFIDRIHPNEVFYADGHHEVSTSNYESVLTFAQAAKNYPKPCKGKHHCFRYQDGNGMRISTLHKLPFRSNQKGFGERRKNGRIAGKNLIQLLNEIPGASKNDTLYLVAHSMGYAYALGIVDVLKKQCVFGSFYIIAPENASAGGVQPSQWQEVFQYGSIPFGKNKQAPCLQDGVAPQKRVSGLPAQYRLTFPKEYQRRMGFTESHFIGYYEWIFDIPKEKVGAVRQY